jgi:hypothetical protein
MKQIIAVTFSLLLGACSVESSEPDDVDTTSSLRERLEALGIANVVDDGGRLLLLDVEGVEIGQSLTEGDATLTSFRGADARVIDTPSERIFECGAIRDIYHAADRRWEATPARGALSAACVEALSVAALVAELKDDGVRSSDVGTVTAFGGCESADGWVIDVQNGTAASRCDRCLSHIGYNSCPSGSDCSTHCSHGLFSTSCDYSVCSGQFNPESPPEY